MGIGVFGKLPAKRDYVQKDVPRELMDLLDPWLQAAMAESQEALGEQWLDYYLAAPIWRFWLGAGVIGNSVLGAMMPSVDWIGRYFPLCIVGTWDAPVEPPEINAQAEWFAGVEELMLHQLMSETATYEELLEGVAAAGAPVPGPDQLPGDDLPGQFARLRHQSADSFYGRLSYWWVPPHQGTGQPARARMFQGMPAPVEYASMIKIDQMAQPSVAVGDC